MAKDDLNEEEAAEAADAIVRGSKRKKAEAQPQQTSALDIRLEDVELNEFLAQVHEHEPKASEEGAIVREAKKGIKSICETRHPMTLNSDDDGEHSGYVISVGPHGVFRFRPRASAHGEEEVAFKRHAGKDWEDLEIEKVDLFSA